MWRMVVVLMLMGLCVHTAAALPGSGTQQDPFRIESLADFDEFASDPNYWAGFTRLETDVNLTGRTYSTAVIAPDTNNANYWQFDGTAFTGVFDGNAHKIMWLTIEDGGAGNYFLGLFGCIHQGEVKNLGLESISVSGTGRYVGGLVGYNNGNVSNCYSTGDVSGEYRVGGLVGGNGGNISDCYSTGDVNGDGFVGGLVGSSSEGSVLNCYSTGCVSGIYCVGGLVGSNGDWGDDPGGAITNCYSAGDVNGTGDYVGGLVGENDGILLNCYSTGSVMGTGYVGGLVGWNSGGSISNCYSSGDVSGSTVVGGLVGWNYGTISDCYSTGDVNGVENVGGLVGRNGWSWCDRDGCYFVPGYIVNSYSTGSVQGDSGVGGLVGSNVYSDIERSFWDVETSGEPNMCGYQEEGTGCDPNCGKTTAEMKTKSTFTSAGWDFIEIWGIGENQTYPFLRFAPAGDFNYDKKVDLFDLAILASHWLEEN